MTISDSEQRLSAYVSGRVQGVGFRDYVVRAAREQGLRGWVRNRVDGRLEVVAEGPRPALERLAEELKEGPRLARVERIETDYQPARGDVPEFRVEF